MISSEEFQQKLQAGDIQAALALVVREAISLDVTTRLTATAVTNGSINNREYLRTKINLLTGEIQNEVGKDLVTDGTSYIKLQQLHVDQIVASHRIVQGYLHQIKAILMVLSPTAIAIQAPTELDRDNDDLGERLAHSLVSADRSNPDALAAKLTQAATTIANNASRHQVRLDTPASSIVTDLPQPKMSDSSNFTKHITTDDTLPIATVSSIKSPIDNDIDLSVAKDGEVWEEWVETEKSISEPIATPQPASATIPDWEEQWVRRSLNPIDVKPTILRSTASSIEPSAQWDKFVPEYIGIDADSQPQFDNNYSPQIDKE